MNKVKIMLPNGEMMALDKIYIQELPTTEQGERETSIATFPRNFSFQTNSDSDEAAGFVRFLTWAALLHKMNLSWLVWKSLRRGN